MTNCHICINKSSCNDYQENSIYDPSWIDPNCSRYKSDDSNLTASQQKISRHILRRGWMNMIIFVAFDNTLCLHTKDIDSKRFIDKTLDPYKYSVPNNTLINYLQKKKDEGADIILLSASSSFMLDHKKVWCDKYAKDIFCDFVGISIDCTKLEYISSFASIYNMTWVSKVPVS